MNINRIKKNIKKVEEIVESIDVQDVINRMEKDKENSIEEDIEILESIIKINNDYLKGIETQTINQKEIKALEHILSDYKKTLKENEILKKEKEQAWEEWNNLEQGSYEIEQKLKQQIKESQRENEELKRKNNAIKRENEAYAENMIRLDNELNLEKEKSKYEWIRQNCLPQELVNKLYIPIQKVKDKIEEILNNGEYTIIFEGDAEFPDEATRIDAQKYIKLEKLQELLESEE